MPSNDNPEGPFAVIRAATFAPPSVEDVMSVSTFHPALHKLIHQVVSTSVVDLRPKLTAYANGYSVAFRNEQGDRVCVMIGLQATAADIERQLRSAWGWKLSELASPETLARLHEGDRSKP
jgi:hypothetical protein